MTTFGHSAKLFAGFSLALAALSAPAFATDITTLASGARSGDAQAQFQLGNAYAKGDGVAMSATEGVRWYRTSAEQGYAPAQTILAMKYTAGDGVAVDHVEADKWIILASTADHHNNALQRLVEGRMSKDDLHQGHAAAAQWTLAHPANR